MRTIAGGGAEAVASQAAGGQHNVACMPDSTGFGDCTETGQVVPVSFQSRKGGYGHCMFPTSTRRSPVVAICGAFLKC